MAGVPSRPQSHNSKKGVPKGPGYFVPRHHSGTVVATEKKYAHPLNNKAKRIRLLKNSAHEVLLDVAAIGSGESDAALSIGKSRSSASGRSAASITAKDHDSVTDTSLTVKASQRNKQARPPVSSAGDKNNRVKTISSSTSKVNGGQETKSQSTPTRKKNMRSRKKNEEQTATPRPIEEEAVPNKKKHRIACVSSQPLLTPRKKSDRSVAIIQPHPRGTAHREVNK